MEFGFGVPTRGPLSSPENLTTLATKGEEMGFDIISVSDHIVIPRSIDSVYPYNESGRYAGGDEGECLEQLTTMSYLASATSTIRLMTSVLVLPHRGPVLTAKILATIDVLSGGRLIVGCGVGWMEEEFVALGAPPYKERGAVGDEYIQAFKELWTSDSPTFDGKYCSFANVAFAPKPVQKPHPPIWIGGESPPALRRAARYGDAWFPIGSNPRYAVGSADQLREYISRVLDNALKFVRDPSELDFAYSANWFNDETAQVIDGERRVFTGSPAQISGDIKAFEELGVGHIMLNLQSDTLDGSLSRMDRFANNVRSIL